MPGVGILAAMAAAAGRPRRGGILREGYDYTFSRCDPATGAHVDPAWCAVYETATLADSEGRPDRPESFERL